jgi:hypothetical protein
MVTAQSRAGQRVQSSVLPLNAPTAAVDRIWLDRDRSNSIKLARDGLERESRFLKWLEGGVYTMCREVSAAGRCFGTGVTSSAAPIQFVEWALMEWQLLAQSGRSRWFLRDIVLTR